MSSLSLADIYIQLLKSKRDNCLLYKIFIFPRCFPFDKSVTYHDLYILDKINLPRSKMPPVVYVVG